MNLNFSQYEKNLLVGRTAGNEILAVRVLNADGTVRYTESFDDSRHADRAISDARDFLRNPYPARQS